MNGLGKLKAHLDNIAFSHSVFALPFAYMGAVLASGGLPPWRDLFWITLAMVGARSSALAINNLVDLKYDRIHPRFTKRPLVSGVIARWEAVTFIVGSLAVFLLAASRLHPVCLRLAPLAIVPFVIYPYMKRISWTCHLVLGLALACAPVGAWLAVRGDISLAAIVLGTAVAIWIAGFDVIYGCLDVDFDRAQGLHSMPVRFGIDQALVLAKLMHSLSISGFIAVGVMLGLGWPYFTGVLLAAGVLVYQHTIVSARNLSAVTQKYFMRNGLVSIFVFLFTLISLELR
ncbi:4-hydroxybenzoate octaprenyltransferase [Anaerosporomusa subterranea]|uniref:4-hydroxybenzoate polyprenyltransferase n=1 Tax=Anaerosporomusa subterranea TaxID=1794912 RepID=A0A154BSC4_ANASB|nr:4-hydroxybenzoate octaprenyltransferase [Anaerosporomusa subterranea]